mgnify:CR=1 FL=1
MKDAKEMQEGVQKEVEEEVEEENIIQQTVEKTTSKIDQALTDLKTKPEVINDIIITRREANQTLCDNAIVVSTLRYKVLSTYKTQFQQASIIGGNFSKEIALIDQVIAEQQKIQDFISSTKDNLSNYVSNKSDKTIDKANSKNKLMSLINDTPARHIITEISKNNSSDGKWKSSATLLPSLEQLQDELKLTKQTAKIWQGLSKIQGDDDRSKGYAALSDNLASMAMSGINTGRQGMAFAWALLTYAVVDVLWTGLMVGAGKGLGKGANTGYKGANQGIKSAANAMYRIKKGADKALKQEIVNQVQNIKDSFDPTETGQSLNDAQVKLQVDLDQLSMIKDVTERVNKFKEAVSQFNSSESELDKLYRTNIDEVERKLTTRKEIMESKPNLATKGVAAVGGVVGGIVVGITNALWEGVKNPLFAVYDIKGKAIVIDLFFTSCGSICPQLTRSMAKMQQSFIRGGNTRRKIDTSVVQFISLSIDPERDSVPVLKSYADRYDVNPDNWWMLTGNRDSIYNFIFQELKIDKLEKVPVSPEFPHTGRFVLLDRDYIVRGRLEQPYSGLANDSTSMATLARDIGLLMLEKDRTKKSKVFTDIVDLSWLWLIIILCVTGFVWYMSQRRKING